MGTSIAIVTIGDHTFQVCNGENRQTGWHDEVANDKLKCFAAVITRSVAGYQQTLGVLAETPNGLIISTFD